MSMISEQIKEIRWLKDMIVAQIPSKSLIKNTKDILERAIDTIETLSVKVHANNLHRGWIPCSERMPKHSLNSVIGWDEYRNRCCLVQYFGGRWILGNGEDSVKIIAWMPLPEAYMEE